MIILENISLRRGPKLLFGEVSATLQPGQKIALIGANGSGKSSFFALLMGVLLPDSGDIRGLSALRLSHMAQEPASGPASARDFVLAGDESAFTLLEQVAAAEAREDYDEAARLHQALDLADGYSAPRRAEQLLIGLGFEHSVLDKAVDSFSGGWRIRLNLARALMSPSDILLLDEPTNHLDLDASIWLENWLKSYAGTLVMISHDRDFIDACCDRTLKISNQTVEQYRGGYSDYERQRAEQLIQHQASFEKQQRRIAEIEDFVRRFRAKATKAKQAQSRLKELERMQRLAPAHSDSPFEFGFPAPGKTSDPLMLLRDATIGYGDKAILERISITLTPGDRIGLLGKNGAGKSTLLKTLTGELPLLKGERTAGMHLRIGYFDQQQLDVLDFEASPLLHLQRLTPDRREQELLDFLGGFNFRGDMARDPIAPFSGGEKARLALAMVVWQNPNLLILDEPTNHLDLDMHHALEVALQGFTGALVLVSHDRHLMRNVVENLMLVDEGKVAEYPGDLHSYEQWVISRDKTATAAAPDTTSNAESAIAGELRISGVRGSAVAPAAIGGSKKNQRKAMADLRRRLRPLTQALAQTEKKMDSIQKELALLQEQLAEPDMYNDERKDELAQNLKREGELKGELAELEAHWLEQQEEIEAAGG